ncbi:tail fiber domain-containing protein, partial [Klebsiella quasipneumoniae]
LKPQQYRLKNGDGKWVIGYIAQDVLEAFANEGIDAFEYSVVAKGEDGYLALQYEQLAILKAMVN